MSEFGHMRRSWECSPNFFDFASRNQIKSLYKFRLWTLTFQRARAQTKFLSKHENFILRLLNFQRNYISFEVKISK